MRVCVYVLAYRTVRTPRASTHQADDSPLEPTLHRRWVDYGDVCLPACLPASADGLGGCGRKLGGRGLSKYAQTRCDCQSKRSTRFDSEAVGAATVLVMASVCPRCGKASGCQLSRPGHKHRACTAGAPAHALVVRACVWRRTAALVRVGVLLLEGTIGRRSRLCGVTTAGASDLAATP